MNLYHIHNPGKNPRVFYDELMCKIEMSSGERKWNVPLDPNVAASLYGLEVTEVLEPSIPRVAVASDKPPLLVTGMFGIGDNIHMRGPLRELLKTWDIWLETCHYHIFWDFVQNDGLKLIMRGTKLRAQAKTIERERHLFRFPPPPQNPGRMRFYYNHAEVQQFGSIAQALYGVVQLPIPERPDFTLPIPDGWMARAQSWIDKWDTGGRPLMIYRPVVIRREWSAAARNCDPRAYAELYRQMVDKFFVVSIADLQPGLEDIVGGEQFAHVKLHKGELDFQTMAALFKKAAMVMSPAGFAPVLAQSVGTPSVTVYGCRESFRTTERAGGHLAPTLGIDPDVTNDCHSMAGRCGNRCAKHITLQPAKERLSKFVEEVMQNTDSVRATDKTLPAVVDVRPQRAKTLIIATTYVDCKDKVDLIRHWLQTVEKLNPDCDMLVVDSFSPMLQDLDWIETKAKIFRFGDNIGHLSRRGKDGWGRAFCKGLQTAIDDGYEYVVHIEGDSLFRLPITPIVEQMKRENIRAASVPVLGTTRTMPRWVETGLMFFEVKYLQESRFIERYGWQRRTASPTPEAVIYQMLGETLKMMNWKALRGDRNDITHQNVLSLGLDWVTHCHKDVWVYDRFAEEILCPTAPTVPALCETSARGSIASGNGLNKQDGSVPKTAVSNVKLNLGCGTNKLKGWENHDEDVDITKKLPWGDDSVNRIFAEHVVEHVSYYDAIAFFKECHRVLEGGGIIRICVPSIEQIYRSDDADYYKFTTRWQKVGPTKRGAMEAILYAHGHRTAWTASLLEATLYYCGFTDLKQCQPGQSDRVELKSVEGHGRVIGDRFNNLESCIFEGIVDKPLASMALAPLLPDQEKFLRDLHPVAIVVGGSDKVMEEVEAAKKICNDLGRSYKFFVVNDAIASFREDIDYAVTLHPAKIKMWLDQRNRLGYRYPGAIWSHERPGGSVITNAIGDWQGSSGLLAVRVALHLKFDRIILAGVPMDMNMDHFLRKRKWTAAETFKRGWHVHKSEISPYVRSMSGWTAQQLGTPSTDWLSG